MKIAFFLFFLTLHVTLSLHNKTFGNYKLTQLGSFRVTNPAFMNVARLPTRTSKPALVMTSFSVNPFEGGRIRLVENIEQFLETPQHVSRIRPRDISQGVMTWTNEADRVPYEVFGADYLWAADGFLVPGKRNGGVYILEAKTGSYQYGRAIPISQTKANWFYHKVMWIDMNGDGRLDCLTARAIAPIFGGPARGELLWLEHPARGATQNRWTEHILTEGPDVHFILGNWENNANSIELVATQFFTERLMLYSIAINTQTPRVLYSRLIDDTIGKAYDVKYVDLNGDGKRDLLVTNHQGSEEESGVFAYDIPANVRTGTWEFHVVSRGFITRNRGAQEASPGMIYSFYPRVGMSGRPHLLVAGDGSQQAYYFYPVGGQNSWKFSGGPILRVGGTQGDVAFGDVDGDGWVEVFIPNYDGNVCYVYRFGDK